MRSASDEARGFLGKNGMDPAALDVAAEVERFLAEMERGLRGERSSLKMIPTFIETAGEVPRGRPVIAVDAGGTNLRVAVVRFDAAGEPVIERFRKHPMPGIDRELSPEELFDALAGHLREVRGASNLLGFSFSYPAEILPSKDGRIISLCKEVRVRDIAGKTVGESLKAALQRAGLDPSLRVVVLNDTVGALLAGRMAHAERAYSSHVGFILGTGTNAAYVERNHRILKRPELRPEGTQIINAESGAYALETRGAIDRAFDATTEAPGTYFFEKAVSGAYLGGLTHAALRAAADDGLLSPGGAAAVREAEGLETRELNGFLQDAPSHGLHGALGRSGTAHDMGFAREVARLVVERAARLTAVAITAALLKGEAGVRPAHPVCVTVEGSTYYGLAGFRELVAGFIDRQVEGRGVGYELTAADDAALVGAAVAGLTN